MNIDKAMFLPNQQPSAVSDRREGDIAPAGFAAMLASLVQSGSTYEDADPQAATATAINPQIGSLAKAFSERPVVLLTAIDLGISPDQSAVDGAGRVASLAAAIERVLAEPLGVRAAIEGESGNLSSVTSQLAERESPLSAHLARQRGDKRMELHLDTQRAAVAQQSPRAQSKADSPSEVAAQRTQVARAMPDGSASNSPFSAVLTMQDGNHRLVLRTPVLTAGEREELEDAIEAIFARRGLASPKMLIHSAKPTRSQGNS